MCTKFMYRTFFSAIRRTRSGSVRRLLFIITAVALMSGLSAPSAALRSLIRSNLLITRSNFAGNRIFVDHHLDSRSLLHSVETFQAPFSPGPANLVMGVGQPLQVLDHEPGNKQRAAQEARRADSRDPPVDDDVGVQQQRIVPIVDSVSPLVEGNQALAQMQSSPQFGKYVLAIE